ncbi:MAG: hypothetical protein GXY50_02820 [Syntrophomonadaceae bacterium]|nr:hypothetical protein [Syntrophomonadaceae bacterium]
MIRDYWCDWDTARKRLGLGAVAAAVVMILAVTAFSGFAAGAEAKIMLKGRELVSDQGPSIVNNRIMLPMRVIFEALGAEVSWNEEARTVKGIKDGTAVELKIGSSYAEINGRREQLDCPAIIMAGRTFVPLRLVAESLDMEVSWDANTKIAALEDKVAVTGRHGLVVGDKQIYPGQSKDEMIRQMGMPSRIDPSESGFQWYIYNSNYARYLQIGIKDNSVVAVYTNAANFTFDGRLKAGMTRDTLRTVFKEGISLASTAAQISTGGMRVTAFIDIQDNNKVTSVLIRADSIRDYGGSEAVLTPGVLKANELQLFDLTNAVRARQGVTPLVYDDKVAAIARLHSEDMAKRNYFSHDSLDGKSVLDRMKKTGYTYMTVAENIAAGQQNAINAHEELMNSKGHRQAILNGTLKYCGTGVAVNGEGRLYFTHDFYTLF